MAVANKLVNKPVQKVETTKYMANGMQVTLTPGTVKNYLIGGDKDRVSDRGSCDVYQPVPLYRS